MCYNFVFTIVILLCIQGSWYCQTEARVITGVAKIENSGTAYQTCTKGSVPSPHASSCTHGHVDNGGECPPNGGRKQHFFFSIYCSIKKKISLVLHLGLVGFSFCSFLLFLIDIFVINACRLFLIENFWFISLIKV